MTPEELLDQHTAAVAELAGVLRRLVQGFMPDAEERVYVGWHGLGYVHPDAGYVCGIFPGRDSVKLLFEYGYLLPDTAGIFTGGGEQTRHIELAPGDAIPTTAICELVADAIDLGTGR